MPKIKDLTGKSFGLLTVIKFDKLVNNRSYWICRCSCGTEKSILRVNLIRRNPSKCYCGNSKNPKFYPKEYQCWSHIKDRCYNPKNPRYKTYGARGVQVCERWLNSFDDFLSDIGPAPTKRHTLDRKDNNGHYEPSNCRWATYSEQAQNTTRTVLIEYKGQKKTLRHWCNELGLSYVLIRQRLWKGWSVDDAFLCPISYLPRSR